MPVKLKAAQSSPAKQTDSHFGYLHNKFLAIALNNLNSKNVIFDIKYITS